MRLRKAEGTPVQLDGIAPIRVLMGWSEGISRSDAVELAKGYIQKRFTSSPEAGWFVVAPFMGGFMWEVQEGGPGISYMPAALEALARDPGGRHWFPCGDRAFQIMMRDGKPFAILLSSADSKAVIQSGDQPLMPSGRMNRAVRKGNSMLIVGSAMFGSGFAFLAGAMVFYGLAADPVPQVKDVNLLTAPHAQWGRVSGTTVREVVTKIELKKGTWKIEKRPHVIPDEPVEVSPAPQQKITEAQQPTSPIAPQGIVPPAEGSARPLPMEAITPSAPTPEMQTPAQPVQIETAPAVVDPMPPAMPEVKAEDFMPKAPTEMEAPKADEAKPSEPAVLTNAPLPPVRPAELGGGPSLRPTPGETSQTDLPPGPTPLEPIQPSIEPNPVPAGQPAPEPMELLNLPQAAPPPDAIPTTGKAAPTEVAAPAAALAETASAGKAAKTKGEAKRPEAKSKATANQKSAVEAKRDGGKEK